MVVARWWILARNRDMAGLVELFVADLHVILLVTGETTIVLHNVGVSA